MYNGIGLQTARGSGTNGYVQTNKFNLRNRPRHVDYKELDKIDADRTKNFNRKGNEEILEHNRKREIEMKLFELRDQLEEEG